MNWKHYFTTSIGKKLQMSLTGLFLILFLIVHCYVNAQIFYNDGGKSFSEAAHFMGSNFLIRTVEIGLFAFLILHIVQGLMLWSANRSKRSVKYAVSAGNKTSKWYSRSMALLGTLILLFLVLHLFKFWGPNRFYNLTGSTSLDMYKATEGRELNLYAMMRDEFQVPWVVAVYIFGCISLGWHLVHGFYSAFQTLGMGTFKYKSLIKCVGVAFAIIVPLIFALMPIAFFAHLLS